MEDKAANEAMRLLQQDGFMEESEFMRVEVIQNYLDSVCVGIKHFGEFAYSRTPPMV